MAKAKIVAGWITSQIALGVALHFLLVKLPVKLVENAMVGAIDDQIGMLFGITVPNVVTWAIEWGLPFLGSGLVLWLFYILTRPTIDKGAFKSAFEAALLQNPERVKSSPLYLRLKYNFEPKTGYKSPISQVSDGKIEFQKLYELAARSKDLESYLIAGHMAEWLRENARFCYASSADFFDVLNFIERRMDNLHAVFRNEALVYDKLDETIDASTPAKLRPVQQGEELPRLKDLFETDFRGHSIGGLAVQIDCGTEVVLTTGEKEKKVEVLFKIIQDFGSHSQFLTVYIPESSDTFILCEFVAKQHKQWLQDMPIGLEVGGASGVPSNDKDLLFTGRVYVYHETAMTLSQLGKLDDLYKELGLRPEFRGKSYALAISASKKV